jgi:hypothetical protein
MSVVSDLPAALADVRRPGDFFADGIFDWRASSICVAGVGPISLPLLEEQAKRLIGVAERAPYGRREETIVDVAVRNSRQIDASLVEIAGARWAEALAGVVACAAEGLGVEGDVEAVFSSGTATRKNAPACSQRSSSRRRATIPAANSSFATRIARRDWI